MSIVSFKSILQHLIKNISSTEFFFKKNSILVEILNQEKLSETSFSSKNVLKGSFSKSPHDHYLLKNDF
jgi:hypothetical protein